MVSLINEWDEGVLEICLAAVWNCHCSLYIAIKQPFYMTVVLKLLLLGKCLLARDDIRVEALKELLVGRATHRAVDASVELVASLAQILYANDLIKLQGVHASIFLELLLLFCDGVGLSFECRVERPEERDTFLAELGYLSLKVLIVEEQTLTRDLYLLLCELLGRLMPSRRVLLHVPNHF